MSKSGLLARQKAERELWTIKVIAYTEQQTLDAVCLALAEGFGFGEERLKRFHDAFNAKYAEIRELEKGDKISQLVIMPIFTPALEIVSHLDSTERGDGGFGSTGK